MRSKFWILESTRSDMILDLQEWDDKGYDLISFTQTKPQRARSEFSEQMYEAEFLLVFKRRPEPDDEKFKD